MKFEIWNKSKIEILNQIEKEQWFECLNNGLEEDRGFNMNNPNIIEIQTSIKKNYINYLENCSTNKEFYSYYVLYNDKGIIVSLLRVIQDIQERFFVEGLETHRDFRRKGYAKKIRRICC